MGADVTMSENRSDGTEGTAQIPPVVAGEELQLVT